MFDKELVLDSLSNILYNTIQEDISPLKETMIRDLSEN